MFCSTGVRWGTRVRHLEFGGCCCWGEVLRESRQEGLGLERGILGRAGPQDAPLQLARSWRGPASVSFLSPGSLWAVCTLSTMALNRRSDLGGTPAGSCHVDLALRTWRWMWPTRCFVLVQSVLKKHVKQEKILCLFWFSLRWLNEHPLAYCVAGVEMQW